MMKRNLKKLIITISSAILCVTILNILSFSPPSVSGKTYYFSTSGNDSNDGLSQSKPKLTLSAASGLMNPGNTILFKRGDSWYNPSYEWNFSNKTGTPSSPILIDAYGSGSKPIIACMELMTSGWTNSGLNRWSHSLGGYTDARRCFINGVSKLKVAAPDSVDADYKFAVAASTIYVYSKIAPGNVEVISNSSNEASISILSMANCSYITFRNLDFRGGSKWIAINVSDQSSHVTFDSCKVLEVRQYGISFSNSGTNFSLYHESPVIKNCYLNMGWTAKECDPKKSYGGDGIDFRNAVLNGLIQKNTIVNFQHVGITLATVGGPDYIGVNHNIVELNETYLTCLGYNHAFCTGGPEGKCTGNIIRRNYFHDFTTTCHVLGDGNYVYSNIFKNVDITTCGSTKQANAIDMMPFKAGNAIFLARNNVIVNNTIYDTEMSPIRISSRTSVYRNIIKNNIVMKWVPSGTYDNYGLRNDGSYEPQLVENNSFYNLSDTEKVIRQDSSYYTAGQANVTFINYKNNIEADPFFVDPENGNFHLQSVSPCKAAGQTISGMDSGFVDYYGNAWAETPSMGAIQYKP